MWEYTYDKYAPVREFFFPRSSSKYCLFILSKQGIARHPSKYRLFISSKQGIVRHLSKYRFLSCFAYSASFRQALIEIKIKSRGRPLLFLLSLRTPTCSSRCRCHSSSWWGAKGEYRRYCSHSNTPRAGWGYSRFRIHNLFHRLQKSRSLCKPPVWLFYFTIRKRWNLCSWYYPQILNIICRGLHQEVDGHCGWIVLHADDSVGLLISTESGLHVVQFTT